MWFLTTCPRPRHFKLPLISESAIISFMVSFSSFMKPWFLLVFVTSLHIPFVCEAMVILWNAKPVFWFPQEQITVSLRLWLQRMTFKNLWKGSMKPIGELFHNFPFNSCCISKQYTEMQSGAAYWILFTSAWWETFSNRTLWPVLTTFAL